MPAGARRPECQSRTRSAAIGRTEQQPSIPSFRHVGVTDTIVASAAASRGGKWKGMVIEHAEWVGARSDEGIQGQRIAIMGFSHWGETSDDWPGFTQHVIQEVCKGRSHTFFDRIQEYFEFQKAKDFWSRVVFFNFIPDLIGGGESRFAYGSLDQHERGRERFLQIVGRRRPEKVLVFSRKAWDSMGAFREADPQARPLGPEFPASFGWGTYERDGHVAAAFGLRHTQGAVTEEMTRAVRRVLETSVPLSGPCISPETG